MEPDKKEIDDLLKQKDLFFSNYENSMFELNHLDLKRRQLKIAIREKIQKSRDEERRKKSETNREILRKLLDARNYLLHANYDLCIKECENLLLIDIDNADARNLIHEAEIKIKEEENRKRLDIELKYKAEQERIESFSELKKLFRENRFEEVLKLADDIIKKFGQTEELLLMISGSEEKLREIKQESLRIDNEKLQISEKVERFCLIAKDFLNQGLYEKALEYYNKAFAIDSRNIQVIEGISACEEIIKSAEESKERKSREERRKISNAKIEADRLVNIGHIGDAISVLEGILGDCRDGVLEEITSRIKELEILEKKNRLEIARKNEEQRENLIKIAQEREKIFWEEFFKYEFFVSEKRYDEAFHHIVKMKQEFPEKEEINLKLHEIHKLIEDEKQQKRKKEFFEAEEKEKIRRTLGESEVFLHKNEFDAAINKCCEVIGFNKYQVDDARDLLEKIEHKKAYFKAEENRRKAEAEKEEEQNLKRFTAQMEFNIKKAMLSGDIIQAQMILEELRCHVSHKPEYSEKILQITKYVKDSIEEKEKEKAEEKQNYLSLFEKGIKYFENQEYWNAFVHFKNVCELYPFDKDSQEFKDIVLQKIKENEKKHEEEEKVNREFDKDFDLLRIRVARLIHDGDIRSALNDCEKMAAKYPGNSRVMAEVNAIHVKLETYELEQKNKAFKDGEIQNKQKRSLVNEMILKAQFENSNKNYDESLKLFYDALKLDPENKRLIELIQETQNQRNSYRRQLDENNRILSENRKTITGLVMQGDRNFSTNDYESALVFYEKALELDDNNEEIMSKIKSTETIIRQNRKLKLIEEEKMRQKHNDWFMEAQKLFNNNKFSEATELCNKILILDDGHDLAKDLKKQISDTQKELIEKELESERIEQERIKKEIVKREQEKETKLSETKTLYQSGMDFYKNSDYENAVEEWQKIKIIDPSNDTMDDDIKKAKLKIKEKEIAEFQEKETAKQNIAKANNFWRDGRFYFREADYSKAIECWENAIALVGRERHFIDSIEKAQNLLKKKLVDDEKNKILKTKREQALSKYLFLGNRYFNNKMYLEAVKIWEKALELDANNVEVKNGILNAEHIIRTYKEKGEKLPEVHLDIDNKLLDNELAGLKEDENVEKNNNNFDESDFDKENLRGI